MLAVLADRSEIFLQPVQLGRTRNWNDPRLLGKQPGESDLGRRRLFLLRELANQLDQRLIRFAILRREPRHNVAEVRLVELRVLVDGSRKETLAEWAEWNETNAEFFERREISFSGSLHQS